MSRRTFAAFDFDGTLTRSDTLAPFLATVAGRGSVLRALAAESARLAAGLTWRTLAKFRLRPASSDGSVRSYAAVAAAGRLFGAELARSAITTEGRDRIAWHLREGHEVVIVSASLDVYLDEVARTLGVAHVLCTSLGVDERGRCTGKLRGANCRGAEKATRLRALLGDDDVELWAYGNSGGDDEMLALAQHPVRARRGRMRR